MTLMNTRNGYYIYYQNRVLNPPRIPPFWREKQLSSSGHANPATKPDIVSG